MPTSITYSVYNPANGQGQYAYAGCSIPFVMSFSGSVISSSPGVILVNGVNKGYSATFNKGDTVTISVSLSRGTPGTTSGTFTLQWS